MILRVKKIPLTELPVPSTSLLSDVVFEDLGGEAVLRFEFERDGGVYHGGLRFRKVRAYRFRAEGHATVWHVEGTYDTLVEVVGSAWVAELLDAEPSQTGGRWEIHHFMIYVDGAGCFEIAAATWLWDREKQLR